MAVRTRIEPIDSWVSVVVDEDLAPQARSELIATFARSSIAETREANRTLLGRDTPETVFVDGKRGAPLENVNPDRGVIVAEFDLVLDVLNWIWNRLLESSPVLSGEYKQGHKLFADGAEISTGGEIPDAAEYAFTNTVPYARKIEVGKTKDGRDFVIQVEPKIYDRVAREARGRFGNIAQIGYTFRGIVGGQQIAAENLPIALKRPRHKTGRFASMGGVSEHNRRGLRYPTITVKLR